MTINLAPQSKARAATLVLLINLTGCAYQNKQQQGTAVGAGTGATDGALLGQVIGRSTEATLLGAGIGAAVGGLAGNQFGSYMDQQEADLRNAISNSEVASIRREQDILTASFRSEAFFDYGSAALKAGAYPEIDRLAAVFNRYPQTTIRVAGHTDSRGSEQYNRDLSLRRADSVKYALVQHGIDSARIQSYGYGESQPLSLNDAANHQVEIIISPNQRN